MIEETSTRDLLNNVRSKIIKARKKFAKTMWVIRAFVLFLIISEAMYFGEPNIFGFVDPIPYIAPFLMIFIEYKYWRRTKETNSIIASIDGILAVPDDILNTRFQPIIKIMIGDLEEVYGE